jgi:hypothetical protein
LIDLPAEFIRTHQPQQRADQDLDQYRQHLHIVIADKRSNPFKITTRTKLREEVFGAEPRLCKQRPLIVAASYRSRHVRMLFY